MKVRPQEVNAGFKWQGERDGALVPAARGTKKRWGTWTLRKLAYSGWSGFFKSFPRIKVSATFMATRTG